MEGASNSLSIWRKSCSPRSEGRSGDLEHIECQHLAGTRMRSGSHLSLASATEPDRVAIYRLCGNRALDSLHPAEPGIRQAPGSRNDETDPAEPFRVDGDRMRQHV